MNEAMLIFVYPYFQFCLHAEAVMVARFSFIIGDNTEKVWAHRFFAKQKQTCQRHEKWQLRWAFFLLSGIKVLRPDQKEK